MTAPDVRGHRFRINSQWRLDATVPQVREIISDPGALPDWWGSVFMRVELLGNDCRSLDGCLVRLYTKGFLPHTFEFLARVTSLREDRHMVIETVGDFCGRGEMEIAEADNQVNIDIRWEVFVTQPVIRPLLRILKPVFVLNHRWAMRKGRQGLQKAIELRRSDTPLRALQTPTFPHNFSHIRKRYQFRRTGECFEDHIDHTSAR